MAQSALSGPAGVLGRGRAAGLGGARPRAIPGHGATEASPRGSDLEDRMTRGKDSTTAAAAVAEQPTPPKEVLRSQGAPQWSSSLGPYPRPSQGPHKESEGAVFWFQNEANQHVPTAPHPGDRDGGRALGAKRPPLLMPAGGECHRQRTFLGEAEARHGGHDGKRHLQNPLLSVLMVGGGQGTLHLARPWGSML